MTCRRLKLHVEDNNAIGLSVGEDSGLKMSAGDVINIGGTSDYEDLINKPSINGVELIGDVDSDDLGITVPTKTSELDNDSGYITSNDIPPIPSKTSDLTNDSGYITTETDPTVPAWAKAPNKPTYTASEVHALSDNTFIPSALGELDNDMGYITEDDIPPKVTDLGYIDAEEYDWDRDMFTNTLLDDGLYRFVWEDGDDFANYFNVQSLLDEDGNGYVLQQHWDAEEGSSAHSYHWLYLEDGEVVDEGGYSYMSYSEASSSFANLYHNHVESVMLEKTVWDYCDDNLTFDNSKNLIVYSDKLNDENWLIERYLVYRAPQDRFVKLYEYADPSHFYMRHGIVSGGVVVWDDWVEYKTSDNVAKMFVGTSSTAAATGEKAVVCPDFTSADLKTGTMICVTFTTTNSASVGNITLNVNGTGAKGVRVNDAGSITTVTGAAYIKADTTYYFVYNGTYWVIAYNKDNTGVYVRTGSLSLPMKEVTYRYRIFFTSADGNYFVPANNSTSTNATSARAVTTQKIDPFGRIVYYSTTTSVAANSRPGATYLWSQYSGITLGYSFNRAGSALTMTAWKPVYVKCTPQADGGAIIDPTTPFVQDLPTTNDGYIYIFLGVATSATAMELTLEHSVYYHDGTRIRLYT